jgi:RNA polymerase sigma-70 factor, ECF subfamily
MMAVVVAGLFAETEVRTPAGDFEGWMRAEQRRVFLLCFRMLQDRDEADSATQDVFLKAYLAVTKNPGAVDEPARWLTRITVNTCLDKLRSQRWRFWRKRVAADTEEGVWREHSTGEPGADDQVFARQIARRLESALNRLSPRQRAVFTLRHYENRDLEEIAQILDLDKGSVKSHMFRAITKLREELKDLYEAI